MKHIFALASLSYNPDSSSGSVYPCLARVVFRVWITLFGSFPVFSSSIVSSIGIRLRSVLVWVILWSVSMIIIGGYSLSCEAR